VYREDISMVSEAVEGLVQYGLDKGLISEADAVYARNQILDVMGMDEYEEPQGPVESGDLEAILKELLDCAAGTGVLKEDSVVYRDLLDTKLMNCLMPRPGEVVKEFWKRYEESPEKATDWYFCLSRDSSYTPPLPHCKRYEVDHGYPLRYVGHYGKPVQTGKGSKGHCSGQAGQAERLSQMPAVHGERGVCRADQPSGPE